MPELIKRRSKKSGLPPGTLVHIGEQKTQAVKIVVIDYDEKEFYEKEVPDVSECLAFKDKPTVTWINIDGVHQVEIIKKVGECFGFHPLMLEDILNTDQRPKLDDYSEYMYLVLKMLAYDEKTDSMVTEQLSLILGRNFVISFQEGREGDVFNPVRNRLRTGKGRIRGMGADFLAYSLVDSIVDSYFLILEKLGEKIEFLHEKLLKTPGTETLHEIQGLKKDLIFLRKAVWPLREVINSMEKSESPLVRDPLRVYLRDVYDHTIQVIDALETFREILSGMLDIYLSSMSNRLNEIMKFLTVIGTIFMPLTFIAGVYGMNFEFMPELKWRWGYPLVILGMFAIGVSMLVYFRRKRWL